MKRHGRADQQSAPDTGDGTTSLSQQLRELTREVAELREAGGESLTDSLAHLLAAHYVAATRRAAREAGRAGIDLPTLRGLTTDVVALRRGDHEAIRLAMEREQLDLDRQTKIEAGLSALVEELKTNPEARAAYNAFAQIVRPDLPPVKGQ